MVSLSRGHVDLVMAEREREQEIKGSQLSER